MKIALDISQVVYEGTGVARYIEHLVPALIRTGTAHEFILFGASLRRLPRLREFTGRLTREFSNVRAVVYPLPPVLCDVLWNSWHILPIDWLIGKVDIFWSSDWTQPPLRGAIGVTTIHDISILRNPETFSAEIRAVHERKLARSRQLCRAFFCDSEATKADVRDVLHIPADRLHVIYPGLPREGSV